MDFLIFLIIGAISGWLAGMFWRGSGFGCLGNIVVGIIGGIIGGLAAKLIGFNAYSTIAQILLAACGAWLLFYFINLAKK